MTFNQSQCAATFVPHPFRPFWQPNCRGASPFPLQQDTKLELEQLRKKLEIAEAKVDEYAKLIASLYAELNRLQNICTCRNNVNSTGAPPSALTQSTYKSIAAIPTDSVFEPSISAVDPGHIYSTPNIQAKLSVPIINSSLLAYDVRQPAGVHSPPDNTTLPTSSCENTQVILPDHPTTSTPPYFADADSQASQPTVLAIPETTADAGHNVQSDGVQYNLKIKQSLTLRVINTFTFGHTVLGAKFSRDGKYLAVGLENGKAHIYDMITGSQSVLAEPAATVFYTETEKADSDIWALQFSLDNKYITTARGEGQINIWEIARRRVRALLGHRHCVRSLDLSHDGRFLVSASFDRSVCVWRVRDGARIKSWHGPACFMSVAFSPNGRYVAAGNDRGLLSVWDARTGSLVNTQAVGSGHVRLVYMQDGNRIVTGSDILQLWHVRDSEQKDVITSQIWEFKEHKHPIVAVSASSDSRWIFSSSLDHSLCIVDAQSGARVCTFGSKTNSWAADFSPLDRYVVSGDRDRQITLRQYELLE